MNSSLVLLCLAAFVATVFCRQQRMVAKGVLMCGNKPYPGATVKLISKRIGADSTLGKVTSDAQGQFYIDGVANELTSLKGEVKVYHDCDDDLPCQRRWVSKVPTDFINKPGDPKPKVLDVGVVNLNLRQKSEERDCIH